MWENVCVEENHFFKDMYRSTGDKKNRSHAPARQELIAHLGIVLAERNFSRFVDIRRQERRFLDLSIRYYYQRGSREKKWQNWPGRVLLGVSATGLGERAARRI